VRYPKLDSSELTVSRVGLGCNNFAGRLDLKRTRAVVDAALDAGITHFDTADVYGNQGGSERFLGEILEDRGETVVIATKFGGGDMGYGDEPRGSRDYLRRSLASSLERLRTDHVDLWYYHRPDGVTPIGETIRAMQELVDEGSVRAIGVSNFSAAQLGEAAAVAPVAAIQNEYSLLEREAETEVLPRARELGVSFVPYFPLASGLLTGKYQRGEPSPKGARLEGREERFTPATFDRLEAFEAFAETHAHTLLELAISALASQPGIDTVIAGATRPEQIRANAAAGDWQLTPDELDELSGL
jgi:aryl-alcohol dehydrogenase-like predicted oxidoreductase